MFNSGNLNAFTLSHDMTAEPGRKTGVDEVTIGIARIFTAMHKVHIVLKNYRIMLMRFSL